MAVARGPAEATAPIAVTREPASSPERGIRLPDTLLVRVGLIIAAALFLLPFYWMANSALKTIQELSVFPPTFFPHTPAWHNFVDAVTYIPFGTFLLNSVILTTGVTLGAAISNPLIAYGFSRIKWPGREFVFGIVMASIFLPFPVLIVALFDIFAKLQWVGTFYPIIVPAFFGNPFFIFLMRQYFLGLPMEISEQARIDCQPHPLAGPDSEARLDAGDDSISTRGPVDELVPADPLGHVDPHVDDRIAR